MTIYEIDKIKIKEGLKELIKVRVNEIINWEDPRSNYAIKNYQEALRLAKQFDINTTEYENRVREFFKETSSDRFACVDGVCR